MAKRRVPPARDAGGWLPEQDFDYLDFREAQRLIDAADEGWRPMITVAVKTGLRHGRP